MIPEDRPFLRRPGPLALLVGVLMSLLLTATGVELAREFTGSHALRADVNRSYETRMQTLQVLSSLQDAETGVRGYIITGNADYLNPYLRASTELKSQQDKLADLLATRPDQQADRQRMNTLIRRKMSLLARGVARRQSGLTAATIASAGGTEGNRVMDQTRTVATRMIRREAMALNDRSRRAEARTARTEALVSLLFLTLMIVIAGTTFLTWRYIVTRRGMLRQIQATNARQQAIFDSAIDGIITLNPSGSIETINAAGERMFGYPSTDLERRDVSLLLNIAPQGEGGFLARLRASPVDLMRGLTRQVEATRQSGETFTVDVALGAMQLSTGTHVVAVVRDASERRRMETLKTEFVSTVSHELRTPLTSIAGSLGLLAAGSAGPLPGRVERLIQIAQSNCQRLVRLINDILDIEKLESGKLRLDLVSLDLKTVAERSIEDVQGYANDLGVVLSMGPSESVMVHGDEDRLIQVVTNLLSNASKFSPQGGVVTVTIDRETRVARLSVQDRGSGIPDGFRSRIFSKFAQADGSDSRAKGGTGLGLAIAREIAEQHGGRLWFESAEREGSTFHLDLPLLELTPSTAEAVAPRLLIVEDDPDAAETLRQMLESDGFAADIAASAEAALNAVATQAYGAALVDLQLPGLDGIGLIRRLRENSATRTLPVVVVSADIGRGRARGRSLEILDWLEKPVDQDRLRGAVAAIRARRGNGLPLVLHVDDDPDILVVTAAALADAAEVLPAASLKAARATLKHRRPDLVIIDLGLPDGSGLDLLADLGTKTEMSIPVIVYSAQELDVALSGRVETVLTKSRTSLSDLTRAVRHLTRPQITDTPDEAPS